MDIFRDLRMISTASRLVRIMTVVRTLIVIGTIIFAVVEAGRRFAEIRT